MNCDEVSKEYCGAQWDCCECPYNIEWDNPKDHITKNFTVHEALWLKSWGVYHKPSLKEQENIIKTALVMEKIRELFNVSINIHCWIRPNKVNCPGSKKHGKDYNIYVGGAKASMHIQGLACDFHVKGIECIKVFPVIVPYLREFYIRIEKIRGSWVHIDLLDINRIF